MYVRLHPGPFLEPSLLCPMAGIYRQRPACALPHADRHPERTVFYRVLFHYFDEFVAEYENRFERKYGYFRPIIQEVTVCHHEA